MGLSPGEARCDGSQPLQNQCLCMSGLMDGPHQLHRVEEKEEEEEEKDEEWIKTEVGKRGRMDETVGRETAKKRRKRSTGE